MSSKEKKWKKESFIWKRGHFLIRTRAHFPTQMDSTVVKGSLLFARMMHARAHTHTHIGRMWDDGERSITLIRGMENGRIYERVEVFGR